MLTGAVSLETVLLGTQDKCLNGWIWEFLQYYTHCLISVIVKILVIALKLMDGLPESAFLIYEWKMSWVLTGAVFLETVLLGNQDKC